jgi:hypothetical protein
MTPSAIAEKASRMVGGGPTGPGITGMTAFVSAVIVILFPVAATLVVEWHEARRAQRETIKAACR